MIPKTILVMVLLIFLVPTSFSFDEQTYTDISFRIGGAGPPVTPDDSIGGGFSGGNKILNKTTNLWENVTEPSNVTEQEEDIGIIIGNLSGNIALIFSENPWLFVLFILFVVAMFYLIYERPEINRMTARER